MKHLLLVVVCSTSNCNGRRVFAGGKIGEDIAFWFEKVVKKGESFTVLLTELLVKSDWLFSSVGRAS